MLKKTLFILLLCTLNFGKLSSQGTAGKDFWVGFMAHDWSCYYNNNWWTGDTMELFLSSQVAATVYIEAPGQGYSTSLTLTPNVTSMLQLPRSVVCRYSDTITTNGVHVYSSSIINVYAVNRYWYSKGATVVIPTESIVQSPEYIITTNEEKFSWSWSCNGKNFNSAEFVIVGIADSSVIEIVPTGASTRFTNKNTPFQIKLKKGQTFQYMTTDNDLTGSIIRSKYPLSKYAVFAGNRLTFSGNGWNSNQCWSSWDHVYEQMLPTVAWGEKYTSLPFKNNPGGYYLKVLAAENRTSITVNGVYKTTLNQGESYEIDVPSDTPYSIVGGKRISVAQFTKGYNCAKHPKLYLGDPAMMMLFPDQQLGQSATINTVSATSWWWNWWWWNQNEHYVSIMTKTSDKDSFKVDNSAINSSLWKTSSNIPGYSYAAVKIDSGSHYLYSKLGFLGYVYGYGPWEGYAFAAAANFKPIQNNFLIENAQCKKDTVLFSAIENDSFSTYSWRFGDGSSMAYGKKVKHKYRDTGWYSVTMFCKQVRTGFTDSVTKDIFIADTKIRSLFSSDTAICGPVNLVVISKGFNLDNEYKWDDDWPVYYKAIKNPGIYWLEVMERNGCIFRDTLKVTNSAIPQAAFSMSDSVFCLSKTRSISFVNKSTSKDSIDYYTWDFSEATLKTKKKDTVFYKFTKANTYPVVLRATTKFGCFHDTFMFVDVLPSPRANFTFTQKDTCFNTNSIVVKNNTIVNKNDHKRFKWYFSEGYNLSNSNPPAARSYAAVGKYKVMLIYENTNGCIDTMMQTVDIVPNPKAGFTYTSSLFCSLDTVPFTSTTSSSYRPLTYNWQWGDSTSLISQVDSTPRKMYKKAGNYTVKLMVTSPQGCRDSATKSFYVNNTPAVDFLVNKDTQCFTGNVFRYTNITKFGSGSLNYTWNLGDGNTRTDSNIMSKSYIRDSVYSVKLSTTTTIGCHASRIKKVYVGGYPDAKFNITPIDQCFRKNQFNFTNSSTIANGSITSYEWNLGDNMVETSKDVSNKHYLTEDSFTVRLVVKSNLGCPDTVKKTALVFAQPKAGFNINNKSQCFKQQNFILKNQTTLKYGKLSYQWSFGDGKTSVDTNYNKKYSKDSTYTIRLVSNSDRGCKDTIEQSVVVNVSPDAAYQVDKSKQCFKGNLFNFINQSKVNKGAITDYKWLMGDNSSFTTQDVTAYKFQTEDTFMVRLIAHSDKNCYDTLSKPAITFAQPVVSFVIPNDSQCWQKNHFVIFNKTKLKYGVLTNSWDFGDKTTSSAYDPADKVYPNTSASYMIKYKAVSDHGCSDSGQHMISLLERPVSEFSINDSIQCFRGHSFSFANKSTFSAMYTLRYWWDYANGDTSMGMVPKTITFNQPGVYQMRLITYSYLTNCFDTIFKPLVAAPHANVDYTMNNDSQCFRFNKFVFVNKSAVQFGSMTYNWSYGDGTHDTSGNPVKSYATEGSYKVRLVVSTNYDCKDSIEKLIGFYPTPKALFTISDPNQCLNRNSFDFTNNSTLNKGSLTQEWWFGDNTGSNSVNVANKQFHVSGNQDVRLAVMSDQGCKDTLVKTVYLEKDKNSSIDFTEPDSQCLKGNAFNFTNTNHNAQVSFNSSKWIYGDGQESTLATPAAQVFNKDGSFRVALVTISALGCYDTTYADIVIHPHPVTKFTADKVCFPEPVQFDNQTTVTSGTMKDYSWDFGDGEVSGVPAPLHEYPSDGEFDVILISRSSYGCADTLEIKKAAIVQEKPLADFTFDQLPTLKLDQTRYQFNNISSATASKYYWDFGNQTNSTETNPIGMYEDTGSFKVMLVAYSSEGCSDTMIKPTGVVFPDFFYFLPNAFSPNGDLHNNIYKGEGTVFVFSFRMEIFNRWGEKMFETNDIMKGWDGYYNGALCMEGTYMCRVQIVPFKGTLKAYEQMFTLLR